MDRLELLKRLSFGSQVAEEETKELGKYFVETDQWTRISRGDIDIVRGEKGAGKSAIYALLLERSDHLFDDGILLVAAENPRGNTVFKDLAADPPASEREFIILWKLYTATIIAQKMREFGIDNESASKAFSVLEEAGFLEPKITLPYLLRRVQEYARRLLTPEALEAGVALDPVSGVPTGVSGRIVLKEPDPGLQKKGYVSVDSLFALMNSAFETTGFRVWVLFDRLDVAFSENHELEANALRALIHAYRDIDGLDNISMKIFLREDIWKRITKEGLREASHLVKFVVLDWTEQPLLNLLMRRILSNNALIEVFDIDRDAVLRDAKQQHVLFGRLFPKQVEQGAQKPTTFNWMVSRCRDGTGKTAPREIIYLLNCIRDEEVGRLERGGKPVDGDQLFDRSVFKLALPSVSKYRLDQFLYAEYPTERKFIERLNRQKAEQTTQSLSSIWKLSEEEAIVEADKLVEIGFFERRGTREEPTFWVPFLYRDALELVQGKADDE